VENETSKGGANGGVDDDEQLRRARLKAISRQQRAAKQAAGTTTKHPAPVSMNTAPCLPASPALEPSKLPETGAGRTLNEDPPRAIAASALHAQGSSAAPRTAVAHHSVSYESVSQFREAVDSLVRDVTGAMSVGTAGCLDGPRDVLVTIQRILKNAALRPDRRQLNCCNPKVWDKVIRWSASRRMLSICGFVFTPPLPDMVYAIPLFPASPSSEASRDEQQPRRASAPDPMAWLQPNEARCLREWQAVATLQVSHQQALRLPQFEQHLRMALDRLNDPFTTLEEQPSASEAATFCTPSSEKLDLLRSFLFSIGLDDYFDRLVALGYDDMDAITMLEDAQIDLMCEQATMLPGHHAKLKIYLKKMRALPPSQSHSAA